MGELLVLREKFLVNQSGSVEIRVCFAVQQADGTVKQDSWFECTACEEKMSWNPISPPRGNWECPECGFEMTADEAAETGKNHINIVKQMTGLNKRGFIWALRNFFGVGAKAGK